LLIEDKKAGDIFMASTVLVLYLYSLLEQPTILLRLGPSILHKHGSELISRLYVGDTTFGSNCTISLFTREYIKTKSVLWMTIYADVSIVRYRATED